MRYVYVGLGVAGLVILTEILMETESANIELKEIKAVACEILAQGTVITPVTDLGTD